MNVEIETQAAQFPEKEYINGIFHAVYFKTILQKTLFLCKNIIWKTLC